MPCSFLLCYQVIPCLPQKPPCRSDGVGWALLQYPSISNKDLRHHIQESENKIEFASDVRKLKPKQSDRPDFSDTAEVDKYLQQIKEGGNIELGHNDDGSFHYLVYMTGDMRNFHIYPERLVLDSPYKTNVTSYYCYVY